MLLAGAASVCAAPADAAPAAVDTGKVTVMVETATLNGKYIQKPVQLNYEAGKDVQYYLEQIKDSSGASLVNVISSSWGPYIDSVKDTNTGAPYIGSDGTGYVFRSEALASDTQHGYPSEVAASNFNGIYTAGTLKAYDYNNNSGWNVVYNNTSPYTGISQAVSEGDCITLAFTVYGGMDIGFPGWPMNADGTWNTDSDAPFAATVTNGVKTDKTALIETIAYVNANFPEAQRTDVQKAAAAGADSAVLNVKASASDVSSALTTLQTAFNVQ